MRVVHVVDVPGALPIDLMDRPHTFGVALVGVRFADLVAQFVLEGREDGSEIREAFGRLPGLGIPSVGGHFLLRCDCCFLNKLYLQLLVLRTTR